MNILYLAFPLYFLWTVFKLFVLNRHKDEFTEILNPIEQVAFAIGIIILCALLGISLLGCVGLLFKFIFC